MLCGVIEDWAVAFLSTSSKRKILKLRPFDQLIQLIYVSFMCVSMILECSRG